MKLADWFEARERAGQKVKRSEFARRIGVTPSMVTAYCRNSMWPGREKVLAIIRETDGAVTADDFLEVGQ